MNDDRGTSRADPAYIEAVVAKKPRKDDPREQLITEKIRDEVLKEQWAVQAFDEVRDLQIAYLKDVIAHVDDADFVHDRSQSVLKEISEKLRSKIVEGANHLRQIEPGSPVLITTNHLGTYKLLGIDPKVDLGVDIENYEFMYPYPAYFAPLMPVASSLQDDLYYVSDDFPGVFGRIHSLAGFVHVPPTMVKGRTGLLQDQTKELISKRRNVALVNFPEGGTSGKYSGLGPYNLDPFKTGAYVIAKNLGMHVVPVVQFFDKEEGFQLRVFEPIIPLADDKEGFERIAASQREQMQEWLDQKSAL